MCGLNRAAVGTVWLPRPAGLCRLICIWKVRTSIAGGFSFAAAGLGSIGRAPFKSVLTHGFTVDEKGMKQSKSLGNYVNAQEEVAKYGADILRLWVASVNYQEDVRCSDELIGRTQEVYRKIRNTLRYLLGNIDDFDPAKDAVAYEEMFDIDKWAMQQLQKLIADVTDSLRRALPFTGSFPLFIISARSR